MRIAAAFQVKLGMELLAVLMRLVQSVSCASTARGKHGRHEPMMVNGSAADLGISVDEAVKGQEVLQGVMTVPHHGQRHLHTTQNNSKMACHMQ